MTRHTRRDIWSRDRAARPVRAAGSIDQRVSERVETDVGVLRPATEYGERRRAVEAIAKDQRALGLFDHRLTGYGVAESVVLLSQRGSVSLACGLCRCFRCAGHTQEDGFSGLA